MRATNHYSHMLARAQDGAISFHSIDSVDRAELPWEQVVQIRDALIIMEQAYELLGMKDLAASTQKVLNDNYTSVAQERREAEENKAWWKFW